MRNRIELRIAVNASRILLYRITISRSGKVREKCRGFLSLCFSPFALDAEKSIMESFQQYLSAGFFSCN